MWWACAEASLILDKQPDEIVYTDCIEDGLSKNQPSIPSKLPCAPSSLSRIDHFRDSNYTYPGGLDKRFDMYLWVTTNFKGGAGGDWGQRVADSYILSTVDLNDVHIIEHEMGHGFGFPDFYEEADIPEGGFPVPTIMWGGNSTTITSWDVWLLRYTWSMLKKDTTRFKAVYQPMVTYGDLNNDGAINSIDFALLKKSVLSDSTEGINAEAADLNKDKSINALDLALMKSYLLGNLKAF